MPEIDFCPACGRKLENILVVKENRNRLVCTNCAYIYYQNPVPVVVAVITCSSKRTVGLVKRAIPPQQGKWSLLGGFMEIDEKPEEAILREMNEEIGINGKVQGLIGVYVDESKMYHKVVLAGYEVEIARTNFSLGSEVEEFKFFPLHTHPPLAFSSHNQILQDFQKTYRNPFPTVDAIIEKNGEIFLVKRKNPPYGWALPGGFVDYGETLENAIKREIKEETNLEIHKLCQFHTYSEPERDPRFHTISTVFIAKANGNAQAGDDAQELNLFSEHNLPPNIVFDHAQIINDYYKTKKK